MNTKIKKSKAIHKIKRNLITPYLIKNVSIIVNLECEQVQGLASFAGYKDTLEYQARDFEIKRRILVNNILVSLFAFDDSYLIDK